MENDKGGMGSDRFPNTKATFRHEGRPEDPAGCRVEGGSEATRAASIRHKTDTKTVRLCVGFVSVLCRMPAASWMIFLYVPSFSLIFLIF